MRFLGEKQRGRRQGRRRRRRRRRLRSSSRTCWGELEWVGEGESKGAAAIGVEYLQMLDADVGGDVGEDFIMDLG